MADPVTAGEPPKPTADEALVGVQTRKEKRKALKKLKRKLIRKEAAIKEREEAEARSNDPAELERIRLREQEEAESAERERREFEERERLWLEAAEKRKTEEEERRLQKLLEESERREGEHASKLEDDREWDYVEDGLAEIIWQGNEIIVKKKRVKVAKTSTDRKPDDEDADRPTSNPLPPQSVAFASYNSEQHVTAEELLQGVAQQVPNFGTEQDKAHCPFHLKTGACRFGTRCSRVHFYPDKSCTLLIKNMYNGPGLAWEQDEGLEYTDEEVERCYEEFYEDVHTEFLKFGELVNFKVCKNGSYHLRGNVYVHYKSLESSVLAYNTTNGRYFAGKQITCEFVGVTRWKVAICGEYMKLRLRTCSHGTACNFIHCFRNPGGDYEWADWDNPPPRYWIRKMAVLFGHPDESSHGKKMEQDDLESPRDSGRTPINGRCLSRRSPRDEIKVHDSVSSREDSYRKRDRRSGHPIRREHSRARKERNFLEKSKQSEENHKSEVHNYDIKSSLRARDSSQDRSKKKDREYLAKHRTVEERNNVEAHQSHEKNIRTREESSSQQKGEDFSDKQERSERNHRAKSSKRHGEEHRLYDQLSNYTGDRRNQSSSRSSEEYFRHSVDAQDRYDGRYCSNDSDSGRDRYCSSDGGSDRDFSSQNRSHHNKQFAERRMDQYNSTHDNGKHSKKGKMIKQVTNEDGSTSDESPGRWKTAQTDSVREETDGHVVEGRSRSHREASKSYEKLKHYREKRKCEVNNTDSDEMYDRRARNKFSRKQASTGCSASSEGNSTKTP